MTLKLNGLWSATMWVVLVAGLSAQTPASTPQTPEGQTPTFRVQIDAVTMDVIVKDSRGLFVRWRQGRGVCQEFNGPSGLRAEVPLAGTPLGDASEPPSTCRPVEEHRPVANWTGLLPSDSFDSLE